MPAPVGGNVERLAVTRLKVLGDVGGRHRV
jgi:hypothetical protein